MNCAICGKPMETVHVETLNRMLCESIDECRDCQYAEHFAYGAHKVVIRGVDYVCGDPSTIEGNLQAWRIWYAIQDAKEAMTHGKNRD